jgi:hypothetical protein
MIKPSREAHSRVIKSVLDCVIDRASHNNTKANIEGADVCIHYQSGT